MASVKNTIFSGLLVFSIFVQVVCAVTDLNDGKTSPSNGFYACAYSTCLQVLSCASKRHKKFMMVLSAASLCVLPV